MQLWPTASHLPFQQTQRPLSVTLQPAPHLPGLGFLSREGAGAADSPVLSSFQDQGPRLGPGRCFLGKEARLLKHGRGGLAPVGTGAPRLMTADQAGGPLLEQHECTHQHQLLAFPS